MGVLASVVQTMGKGALRLAFKGNQHSPELLIIGGVVCGIAAIATTVKATFKMDEILTEANEKAEEFKEFHEENPDKYTDQDYAEDRATLRKNTVGRGIVAYAAPAVLFVCSMTCFLVSAKILHDRNLALAATLKCTEGAFTEYRKRVIADHGEEADFKYRYGDIPGESNKSVMHDIDGKPMNVETTVINPPERLDVYSKFFDETSSFYRNDAERNLSFLLLRQNYLNDLLDIQGYVFLNDAYKELGLPPTKAGQVKGWLRGKGPIDFGLLDPKSKDARLFVNGYDPRILVRFNVNEGTIYQYIGSEY